MLSSYIRSALRLLKRRKLTSTIIIGGLALAVAAFVFALSWCEGELGYDRSWPGAERIYRVWTTMKYQGGAMDWTLSPPPLAGALNVLPEVECAVRLLGGSETHVVVRTGEKCFDERTFFFTDTGFFRVFGLPLLEGDPGKALETPYSCVLSEEMARKYFGTDDPLDKTLSVVWYSERHDYHVTGVMPNTPRDAHFHPGFLASLSSLGSHQVSTSWSAIELCTYLRLRHGSPAEHLQARLPGLIEQALGPKGKETRELHVQPITAIHLHSDLRAELEPPGSLTAIVILGSSSLLILLIAVLNFISLSTTGASERAKGIAIRTVFGARPVDLIAQFAAEHGLVVALGFSLGVLLAFSLLPAYQELGGISFEFTFGSVLLTLVLGLTVTALAMIYPAFVLSRLPALSILRGVFTPSGGKGVIQSAFVIVQFTVATALVACTLAVTRQLTFALNRDLGLSTRHTLLLPLRQTELQAKRDLLETEFRRIKGVEAVSSSSVPPTSFDAINGIYASGTDVEVRVMAVDHDFLETMGLTLVSGRNFSKMKATDSTEAFIINETAARRLAALNLLDQPLGITLESGRRKANRVIGVVKDFHFRPLYYAIQPLVMFIDPSDTRYLEVRLASSQVHETLHLLGTRWKEIIPAYPFSYSLLDEDVRAAYRTDQTLADVLSAFSAVSLVIASLGVLGLAAHEAERRTREIGVRRVLGASVAGIVLLLLRDVTVKLLIAGVIAAGASYAFVEKWLESYAYRIPLSAAVFLEAILSVSVLALFAISVKVLKAASSNPVDTLRYE